MYSQNNEQDLKGKLDFDFLHDRGFVATCSVGAGNIIYNKWGLELNIHLNFVYCVATIPRELLSKISESIRLDSGYQMPSIHYKWELIEMEKLMEIDNTPLMSKMSVEELKMILPPQYKYSTAKGRYKIKTGKVVIGESYNNEEEIKFLSRTLLYILAKEKLFPKNPIVAK